MPRMSGSPALTSVASWRVNWVRTFVLMRPRIQFGNLISMFLSRTPLPLAGFAADFAPFFAVLGALAAEVLAAGAAFFTSPIAVGISPCARTAAIAALRSPASTRPRVSTPAESFAIYWYVAMLSIYLSVFCNHYIISFFILQPLS